MPLIQYSLTSLPPPPFFHLILDVAIGCDRLHPQGKTRRIESRSDRFLGQVTKHATLSLPLSLFTIVPVETPARKIIFSNLTTAFFLPLCYLTNSYKKRKKGFGSRKPSKSLHVNGSGYTKSNNALKQMPASSTSLASTGNSGGGPPPAPQPQQYRNGGVGVPAVAEKKKQGFISKLFGRK
jgi:hypothetical protein